MSTRHLLLEKGASRVENGEDISMEFMCDGQQEFVFERHHLFDGGAPIIGLVYGA